ncbi:MAG: ComEC/Rec2 family competence protein [Armatimonadetes bacterium]|nr:ComEC/Rec2 family competence protein [Armatimonadota bacterium]
MTGTDSGTVAVTQNANAGVAPRYGDTVSVRGRVQLPPTATNPGGFDYRAYLRRHGIFATLAAKRTGDVTVMSPAKPSWRGTGFAVRRSLLGAVQHSPLPEDDKALLSGVMLSDTGRIPYADELAFERSGAVHILSVSGLHLAVFATVLTWIMRHVSPNRRLRIAGNVLAVTLLWTYALASGFSSATVRSAVMLSVVSLAPLFRRDADPVHSLVVAAFGILFFDPLALYDTGAAFSFVCVGAILLWLPPLKNVFLPMEREMPRRVRFARWVLLLFCAGLIAQVAATPLAAYHFSIISLIAPVSGVVTVPVSELLLVIGLGSAGLNAAFPLPPWTWLPAQWLCGLLLSLVRWFAAPDFAAVHVPPPSGVSIGIFYVLFAGASLRFREQLTRRTFFPRAKPRPTLRQIAAYPAFALLFLPLLVVVPPVVALRAAPKRLRVTFLDVGQGDAAIIETPDGAVAVVDGGGLPGTNETFGGDPGSRVVVPYLRRRGVNRIALLAPSHPDEDHVQGLVAVAHALPVDTVLTNGAPGGESGAYSRLCTLLRQKGVPLAVARRGQALPLGNTGVTIEVLHPGDKHITDSRSESNANSSVIRVRYKNAAMLFTGDAEEAAEAELLQSGLDLRADALKIGHHGSRLSSGAAFLAAVRPSVAVIGCGADNNFGHPAPDVLAKLSAVGATTYRTDRQGTIVVTIDGERVSVIATVK